MENSIWTGFIVGVPVGMFVAIGTKVVVDVFMGGYVTLLAGVVMFFGSVLVTMAVTVVMWANRRRAA